MAVGWELLRSLPSAELSRLSDAQIAEHLAPALKRPPVATATA
jgi:vacuolar-type H+-ATPase subunit B/Vma2